ncbi:MULTISPECIES: XkdF-like putative serine protease domain-containing protein [Methanobacterium]|uniref:XkdF-like putative serine protease domain-containing protein n=1 Tax=Methanobacterium TaxID=2160 RepID=UPI001FEC011E
MECVVLANGETDPELYKDSQGDTWDHKTIKQVFTTEANQSSHDLFHEKQKVEGVTTISNYISTEDKTIAGRTVPAGSWIKELMITDDDIIEMIKSNQLNGVSPNFRLHVNATCLKEVQDVKGNLFYNKDIENKECMKPVFLSLVDEPANEYGLNVYSYDKYLEKSRKSKNGGKPMVNKFKEMLKSFGESVVNYADGMDDSETVEMEKADETTETESTTENTATETTTESVANENVLSEENSFEEIENKVKAAVQDKYFPEDENGNKTYIGLALTFSDAVVIQEWDEDKYYKVDYSIDGDTVTLGELQEVELKYVVKGSEDDTTQTESTTETTTETAAESQKSKQPKIKMPKIKINETKLDDTELEKGKEERVNHLGFPIKSTKELAKNSFNF